jgi:hypothetical protein
MGHDSLLREKGRITKLPKGETHIVYARNGLTGYVANELATFFQNTKFDCPASLVQKSEKA